MAFLLRRAVSQHKRRFQQDGFDLDATYITPRIIAMGLPAEGREALYRNPIGQVARFLATYHGASGGNGDGTGDGGGQEAGGSGVITSASVDGWELVGVQAAAACTGGNGADGSHVHVWNCCGEARGGYAPGRLGPGVSVTRYLLEDHMPVPLHVMAAFCAHASAHLEAHPRNVVAVHCKAGKGRTGMLVCALLLWRGEAASAGEAMDLYGARRARDRRGLTVASQRRYVEYFEQHLRQVGMLPARPPPAPPVLAPSEPPAPGASATPPPAPPERAVSAAPAAAVEGGGGRVAAKAERFRPMRLARLSVMGLSEAACKRLVVVLCVRPPGKVLDRRLCTLATRRAGGGDRARCDFALPPLQANGKFVTWQQQQQQQQGSSSSSGGSPGRGGGGPGTGSPPQVVVQGDLKVTVYDSDPSGDGAGRLFYCWLDPSRKGRAEQACSPGQRGQPGGDDAAAAAVAPPAVVFSASRWQLDKAKPRVPSSVLLELVFEEAEDCGQQEGGGSGGGQDLPPGAPGDHHRPGAAEVHPPANGGNEGGSSRSRGSLGVGAPAHDGGVCRECGPADPFLEANAPAP